MRKYLSLLFLLVCMAAFSAQARTCGGDQTIPKVAEKKSAWKKLIRRFEKADSTLTPEDYRSVYYGSAFQKAYNPYDSICSLARELCEAGMFSEAWAVCNHGLQSNPVSLILLRVRAWAAGACDLPLEQQITDLVKHGILLNIIASDGDGRSKETAFKVICVDDEYELMRFMGVPPVEQQSLEAGDGTFYDRIEYKTAEGTSEILYFDITLPFNHLLKTSLPKTE